jgi:hypothetical protein
MKWASWVNLAIGVCLLFAPSVAQFGPLATTNHVWMGIVTMIVAVWSLVAAPTTVAPAWINLVVGIWVFASPWVLNYAGSDAIWTDLMAGVLLVIFSLARMAPARTTRRPTV